MFHMFAQKKFITFFMVLFAGLGASNYYFAQKPITPVYKPTLAQPAQPITKPISLNKPVFQASPPTANISSNTEISHKPTNANAYVNDFKLMTYNVYLMPKVIANWAQDKRAQLIAQSDIMDNQDVVVLNELFDNKLSQTILKALQQQYPHQTPVLGRGYNGWDATLGTYKPANFEDGGVAVVSRWPITKQIQYVYKTSCGGDVFSNKGFVYTRINKKGNDYHVIGTHVQAEDSSCIVSHANIRKQQFIELQNFIKKQNIPKNEVVFIAGDMNVMRRSSEYQQMIDTLQVTAPTYAGVNGTWDTFTNSIAAKNYPQYDGQYLDYVLVSRNHAQPTHWHNQALDVMSKPWNHKGTTHKELSDHYPVYGFAFADSNTKTHSYRDTNSPYGAIRLRNKGNYGYLKVNKYQHDGWVSVDGMRWETNTRLKIDNWYPSKNTFCVMNNDYIRLQGTNRYQSYFNWWFGGGSGNYAYYTKHNNASDRMRIRILNDDGDCLTNGDQIALYDTNTLNGKQYYLQRRGYGNDINKLYLSKQKYIGANETFIVEMPQGKKQDWSHKLVYKPQ